MGEREGRIEREGEIERTEEGESDRGMYREKLRVRKREMER